MKAKSFKNSMSGLRFFIFAITVILCSPFSEKLLTQEFKGSKKNPDGDIEMLIIEGIEAIYDLRCEEYKAKVVYAAQQHNSPHVLITSFSDLFLFKLSKLGQEVPLDKRKIFWNYACIVLTQKMFVFIDEANLKSKIDLKQYKPLVEDHIKKECNVNAIFG